MSSSSVTISPSSSAFVNFFKRKIYQYEVTFSLYMLTPMEKIVFNTFIFLFFSMMVAAITLYMPQHVSTIARRAYFYYAGDESLLSQTVNTQAPTGKIDL